ncbi:MAG: flavin reductase domain protein FMN-binding [Bryobacterales bacterium]|nr:flavin reductase domain protein FMN-binding [Bryobacterales bacterium]
MSSQKASGAAEPADAALFRRVCSRFATGVTVVTTRSADGNPHGLTVNSFTSVSLDPPLVLVSIDARNQVLERFAEGASLAINVLAEDQQEISTRFAATVDDRFGGVRWAPGLLGEPVLDGCIACFECLVDKAVEAGDHIIVIAVVKNMRLADGEPLVFFDSAYRRLRSPD